MNVETHLTPAIARTNIRKVAFGLLGAIGILYIAFVLLYHLGSYPDPWFDEGSYLKVAKNYAFNGNYADYSSEGDRYTGAIISVGPTVILPAALVFKFLGVSIALARLVAIGYAGLMLLALFALCARLDNARFAVLAVALTVVDPFLDFQSYARTVMGEVPGLFFTIAGLWLWLRPGRRSLASLVGVGILFGLAGMTKTTFAMFILPGILLALILDRLWHRQRGSLHFIVPGAIAGLMFFGWTYYTLFLIGVGVRDVTKDLQILRQTTNSAWFLLNFDVNRHNLLRLTDGRAYLGLLVPALVYGAVLSVRRSVDGQRWGTLYLFAIISFLEYVFSIGYLRYAVPSLVLILPFIAFLLYKLSTYLPKLLRLPTLLHRQELESSVLVGIMITGLSWSLFIVPAYNRAVAPSQRGDDVDRLQQYLNQEVPADALIETMDPQVVILSNNTYHTPPHSVMVNIVAGIGPQVTTEDGMTRPYDFRDWADADYVIVGLWGTQYSVHPPHTLVDYDLVRTFGDYQVYKHREDD